MQKEEVVRLLEQAVYWEEEFLNKYDNPSVQELLRSLPQDKYNKIIGLFSQNISDTEKHEKLTKKLLVKIKNGN